jgi:ubiquinone/menaquinone biosynthesis C-methylase UbiE
MKNILDIIFGRGEHVCPWWCCYAFDNPVRKLFQNPAQILAPYVKEGFTIIDIGPGMGYFTIPLLKLAGKHGKVIAVDIQGKMLKALRRRAIRAGVAANLITHLSRPDDFGLDEKADFILVFWMLHEVPDKIGFFKNLKKIMKGTACVLLAEPMIHVTGHMFDETIQMAEQQGFKIKDRPPVSLSRAAFLTLAR